MIGTRFRVAYCAAMCTTKLQNYIQQNVWFPFESHRFHQKKISTATPKRSHRKMNTVTVCCTDCVRLQQSLQSFVFLEHASRNLAIGSQQSFHNMASPFTTVAYIAFFKKNLAACLLSRETNIYTQPTAPILYHLTPMFGGL